MRILGMHIGHDSNLCAIEDGEILGHFELERYYNEKHYLANFYDVSLYRLIQDDILPRLKWSGPDAIASDSLFWLFEGFWGSPLSAFHVPNSYWIHRGEPYSCWENQFNDRTIQGMGCLHHLSHLATSYYTGPFDEALVFAYDGMGEFGMTTAYGIGLGNKLTLNSPFLDPPFGLSKNIIGIAFSAIAILCKFLGNDGPSGLDTAGKVMGLSSYGKPRPEWRNAVRSVCRFGTFQSGGTWEHFNQEIDDKFNNLAKEIQVDPDKFLQHDTQETQDLLATLQDETELYILEVIDRLVDETKIRNLCLGGGCALNVQVNSRLLSEGVVDSIHVPPCCNDGGNSMGNALFYYHHVLDRPFTPKKHFNPYLGYPLIYDSDNQSGIRCIKQSRDRLHAMMAMLLDKGKVIGVARGRSEVGPRALGNRSILADPRQPWMPDRINNGIKHREPWRPFAPVCLADDAEDWFEIDRESPFMLLSPRVRPDRMGQIPAVTHVDGTARLQTVTKEQNEPLYDLIHQFKLRTGVPVLLNTSLNDRGKPLVNHKSTIIKMIESTDLDAVMIEDELYLKKSLNFVF